MGQTVIGIQPTLVVTAAQQALSGSPYNFGDIGGYDDPVKGHQEFVWGRANGSISAAGHVVLEQPGNDWIICNTTNTTPGSSGPGCRVGVAMAALADNDAGWFQIYGQASINTAANAARGTRLNSTGTTGQVDDDGTAGSEQIFGMVLLVATGGVAAVNPNGMLNYPSVGITL